VTLDKVAPYQKENLPGLNWSSVMQRLQNPMMVIAIPELDECGAQLFDIAKSPNPE
jgi:hypothetical protein